MEETSFIVFRGILISFVRTEFLS